MRAHHTLPGAVLVLLAGAAATISGGAATGSDRLEVQPLNEATAKEMQPIPDWKGENGDYDSEAEEAGHGSTGDDTKKSDGDMATDGDQTASRQSPDVSEHPGSAGLPDPRDHHDEGDKRTGIYNGAGNTYGWTADDTARDDFWTADEKAEGAFDPETAKDFLNGENYHSDVSKWWKRGKWSAPCPNRKKEVVMPLATGLGNCSAAYHPAWCSRLQMPESTTKAKDKTCYALATSYLHDIAAVNSLGNASESDCMKLNCRFNLSIHNECCYDTWTEGCPFTMIEGLEGSSKNSCKQFKPPRSGAQEVCQYAETYLYDPKNAAAEASIPGYAERGITQGFATVQNDVYTDFAQCSKWEQHHHIATILDSRHLGIRPPFQPTSIKTKDPYAELVAKAASKLSGKTIKPPQQTDQRKKTRDLGESDVFDVSNDDDGGSGLAKATQKKLHHSETTVYVTTKAKKTVKCSRCRHSEEQYLSMIAEQRLFMKDGQETLDPTLKSLASNDTEIVTVANLTKFIDPVSEGVCKKTSFGMPHSVCKVRKTLRCEQICFLMGYRGRLSKGEYPWKQAFTKHYCPDGKITNANAPWTAMNDPHPESKYVEMKVTDDTEIKELKKGPPPSKQYAVKIVTMKEAVRHLPKVLRENVMGEFFDTEDEQSSMCCFPGCQIPKQLDGALVSKGVGAGKQRGLPEDNPWYWYDSQKSLREALSMELAHTF